LNIKKNICNHYPAIIGHLPQLKAFSGLSGKQCFLWKLHGRTASPSLPQIGLKIKTKMKPPFGWRRMRKKIGSLGTHLGVLPKKLSFHIDFSEKPVNIVVHTQDSTVG